MAQIDLNGWQKEIMERVKVMEAAVLGRGAWLMVFFTLIDDSTGSIVYKLGAETLIELEILIMEKNLQTDFDILVHDQMHRNGSITRFAISRQEANRGMASGETPMKKGALPSDDNG